MTRHGLALCTMGALSSKPHFHAMSPITFLFFALPLVALGLCAFVALLVVLRWLWQGQCGRALALARAWVLAALPGLVTTCVLFGVFVAADPLWPQQDATEQEMQAYRAARDRANTLYDLAGLANGWATAWALVRLSKVARRHTTA